MLFYVSSWIKVDAFSSKRCKLLLSPCAQRSVAAFVLAKNIMPVAKKDLICKTSRNRQENASPTAKSECRWPASIRLPCRWATSGSTQHPWLRTRRTCHPARRSCLGCIEGQAWLHGEILPEALCTQSSPAAVCKHAGCCAATMPKHGIFPPPPP